MPAVQPLHVPRADRRVQGLGAGVHVVWSKGRLVDDGDSAPGRWTPCGTCDHAALKTYARIGAVRLDYCNACDSVTMIEESPRR